MQATKTVDEYTALTNTCQWLGSSAAGSVNVTTFGVATTATDVVAFNATRFHLRPACRSNVLAALDYVFDGVFWADMLATFFTGVPCERSTDVTCVVGPVILAR